jgi:hypothetical protein
MRQTEYVVHTRHKKELTTPYSCKGVWQYGKTNSSFPIGYPSMQGLWSVFTSLSDCTRDEWNQRIIKTLDIIGFLLLLRVTGQPRANGSTTKRLEFSQSYLIQVRLKDVIRHPNITRKYSRPFGPILKFNCHYSPRLSWDNQIPSIKKLFKGEQFPSLKNIPLQNVYPILISSTSSVNYYFFERGEFQEVAILKKACITFLKNKVKEMKKKIYKSLPQLATKNCRMKDTTMQLYMYAVSCL